MIVLIKNKFPAEKDIRKFVSSCGCCPEEDCLYAFESETPAVKVNYFLSRTVSPSLFFQPYLLLFAEKELIIKPVVYLKAFEASDYSENVDRIPYSAISDFCISAYAGLKYLTFEANGENFDFSLRLSKIGRKYTAQSFQRLMEEGFHGLLENGACTAEKFHPLSYLVPFSVLYFFVSVFLGAKVFHPADSFFLASALLASGAILCALFISANPRKWSAKDRRLQMYCVLMETASIFINLYSFFF